MLPNNSNENDASAVVKSADEAIPEVPKLLKTLFFVFLFMVALLVGIFAGPSIKSYVTGLFAEEESHNVELAAGSEPEEDVTWYLCQMHPWIIQPEFGQCLICAMDLVPVDPDRFAGEIVIDPVVLQNIGVRIKPVIAGSTQMSIRTVGIVTYDETRVRDVNLKISGWAEKVHVDTEGEYVRKGDPLLDIYSPELYATQEEYLLLSRSRDVPGNEELLEAVATRLSLFDIGPDQIEEIERNGTPTRTMMIRAPYSGFVINKHVNEGMKLMPGMLVYRIADLSRVWVQASLHEYQLPHVKLGQKASMTLSYLPGEIFEGKVSYIYPYLDNKSREMQIRLEYKNSQNSLKPGMFADIDLSSGDDVGGILVPGEALIRTGMRNIAFVSLGDGKFEPHDVEIGREAGGNMYQVLSGLKLGDKVVVSGQFFLDSESRVRESLAKMIKGDLASEQLASVEFAGGKLVSLPLDVQSHVDSIITNYLQIQNDLYNDSLSGVKEKADNIIDSIQQASSIELPDKLDFWHEHTELATVQKHAALLSSATDLNRARIEFGSMGFSLSNFIKQTGLPDSVEEEIIGVKCGMFEAAPEGGIWLQVNGKANNPFYGIANPMNSCSSEKWGFAVSETSDVLVENSHNEHASHSVAENKSGDSVKARQSDDLGRAVANVMNDYLELHSALFNGHFDHAKMVATRMDKSFENMIETGITNQANFSQKLSELTVSADINSARIAFGHLGIDLELILKSTGVPTDYQNNLIVKKCGMFGDAPEGGIWIQRRGATQNPFFGIGSPMETCAPEEWDLATSK